MCRVSVSWKFLRLNSLFEKIILLSFFFLFFFSVSENMENNRSRRSVDLFTNLKINLSLQLVSVSWFFLFFDDMPYYQQECNNFCWLNAVKETKIVFFVRDNSGEKFLTAHAARRNFSEVICRACAVVVHSWFSHLYGKFCVLALRTFPARPAPFEPRIWWVFTVGSQRPVLIFGFSWLHVQVFPISW